MKILLALMLVLTSCIETKVPENFAEYKFKNSPLALDVANVEIIEEYSQPNRAPNVEHVFPITPTAALKTWANTRLKAAGKTNRLAFIIKDASAVEEKLSTKTGAEGFFTNEISSKINARMEVEMRIYSGRAISDASVNVVATRTQTIAENASLAERNQLMYQLNKSMIEDIDTSLEKNIREHFGNYIVMR